MFGSNIARYNFTLSLPRRAHILPMVFMVGRRLVPRPVPGIGRLDGASTIGRDNLDRTRWVSVKDYARKRQFLGWPLTRRDAIVSHSADHVSLPLALLRSWSVQSKVFGPLRLHLFPANFLPSASLAVRLL